jgi:hypothetical protein
VTEIYQKPGNESRALFLPPCGVPYDWTPKI